MNKKPATVIHVVGNRPQFIKLAVLYKEIAEKTSLNQFIIHTGQHSSSEMSGIFFNDLSIPRPDVTLQITAQNTDEFIGKTASTLGAIFIQRNHEDLVFVYGDTNSTLAAAIAANRSGRRLIHFESGVRTADQTMPEEINRVLTDRLSSVQYCCTKNNEQQLVNEGYGTAISSEVLWTGDLMLDAFVQIKPSEKNVTTSKSYIACTIHRAANILKGENLHAIVNALNTIHKQKEVIIPLHPHTEKRLKEFNIDLKCTVIHPLGYKEMKRFIMDSEMMITDSGGACREAFFARKKSAIIMKDPFWPEIVQANAALNCDADENLVIQTFNKLQDLQPNFDSNIFGDGHASAIIANHLNTIA